MKKALSVISVFVLVVAFSSCKRAEQTQNQSEIPQNQLPAAANSQAQPENTPPPPPPAAPGYEGHTVVRLSEGGVEIDAIESKFPCKSAEDCTSTKYANSPQSADDCACKAACTPFVVNKSEAEKRKAANETHCGPQQWFGPGCPAPECKFIEFEAFRCINGLCHGIAEGGK